MNAALASVSLLDDRQEWLRFSQILPSAAEVSGADVSAANASAADAATDSTPAQWVSHVVIDGMHCAACAFNIEAALMAVPGVRSAQVNATTHRARVVWSEAQVLPSRWMQAIASLGYAARPAADNSLRQMREAQTRKALWRMAVAGFCMMQVMMYAYPAYVAQPGDITPDMVQLLRWASWVLSLPVMLFSCGPFFGNAWRDLLHRRISMDLPVAIGMLITFVVSTAATFEPGGRFGDEVYFDSLTMFVFFLLTGRWLELRMRDRTAGALDALMNRLPDSVARRQPDGSFERVAVRRLVAGDVIQVMPGESFPADGTVLEGQTLADEALLTGESRPQSRQAGDAVVAGSHNLTAVVLVKIERIGTATRFAQIVALMENASLHKPRLALLADRVAKPFLWGVLLTASAAAAWWWAVEPGRALMVAVAVLVVTCPCALSLATPAAMLAAAGNLARRGVLVRHLQALEALSTADTVIFDKTGTLTRDGQRVTHTHVAATVSAAQALQWAAGLAAQSLHPLSRALVAAQREGDGGGPFDVERPASDVHTVKDWHAVKEWVGQGLEASDAQGRVWRLGSWAFCGAQGAVLPATVQDAQVHLVRGDEWLASWVLSEDVREDARDTVAALQALGLTVRILSGDRPAAVASVARELGIDQAQGGCTPQDKLDLLQRAQAEGRKVVMVGDGLNDGPVLAGAHVSVALGQAVPLTQSNADLVLMGDGLGVVADAVGLSRQTLRIVRQNLMWAAAYNALCVPLAWMGWLPPWLAGLGMALSSLLVVMNALRLNQR
jgi:Cu2+-exporting ATPase